VIDDGGHDPADLADWRYEVTNGDTFIGFLDWVAQRDAPMGEENRQLAGSPRPDHGRMVWGKHEFGNAWVFVWMARDHGWTVSDPEDNGFGYPHVTIFNRP
jgi:hypothetical protein